MLFFSLWLQNGVLTSDKSSQVEPFCNLLLQKCLEILLVFFSPSKIADNWKRWLSLTKLLYSPALVLMCPPVAFSDYKSGFGGKFGVQTERQDPSAVGFDYKEKLAKHESQQGTVFTCYFLTSAATSHTVWSSSLSRSTPGMCRHFLLLLFFPDPAVSFILLLKYLLKQGNTQCLVSSSAKSWISS